MLLPSVSASGARLVLSGRTERGIILRGRALLLLPPAAAVTAATRGESSVCVRCGVLQTTYKVLDVFFFFFQKEEGVTTKGVVMGRRVAEE